MNDAAFADALAHEAARLPLLRACPPEQTLATVAPALPACGITRVASVTHLDTLGIPTWVSVRPGGQVLQISNGKGVTNAAAQASATMEACELYLAENPDPRAAMARQHGRAREGRAPMRGSFHRRSFPAASSATSRPTSSATGGRVWVPSSAVYFCRRPLLFETSSNGLASGNTRAEARLHAMYELIERDAICALSEGGRMRLRDRGQRIDPDSVAFPLARLILDYWAAEGAWVVLMALPAAVAVSVIWAVLVSERALSPRTFMSVGSGAHVNPEVALARALTEAAQTRLAKIHGARDDLRLKLGFAKDSRPHRVLKSLTPDTSWKQVEEQPRLDLPDAPEAVVPRLADALIRRGRGPVYGFDLSDPGKPLYCARIIAPRLEFRRQLF